MKEEGTNLYKDWKNNKYTDIEFLNKIFNAINRSEEEIYQDILTIPIDSHAKKFIEKITSSGGSFVVLSAGTIYYIEKLFKQLGITDISIISNNGIYKDGGIHLIPDKLSPFYSDFYGIDKGLVIKKLKKEFEKVYFAGDSKPDLKASAEADLVFAKEPLASMLTEKGCKFVPFKEFKEIDIYLSEIGVI